MSSGTWFLLYQFHTCDTPRTTGNGRVPLAATSREGAVSEARVKWDDLVAEGKHPAPPFHHQTYLHHALVVYVERLAKDQPPFDPNIDSIVSV